ncbi:hypothetical protein Golob_006439 [Gossypium lobatum]|uniref:Uncharacterized protein n=1 Tax=Gossypium lobatum TaxID=34289 RepID=A0A7J8MWE6_9ROSI|nr:hypothetical protein [Gossypium lobatum]
MLLGSLIRIVEPLFSLILNRYSFLGPSLKMKPGHCCQSSHLGILKSP